MTLRSLFINHGVPFPPMGGGSLRNLQNIHALKKHGPVALFSLRSQGRDSDEVSPPPGVSEFFYETSLQSPPHGILSDIIWDAKRYGVLDRFGHHPSDFAQADSHLSAMIRDFRPDLIIVEELMQARYAFIDAIKPIPVIYDAHNCEGYVRRPLPLNLRLLRSAARARTLTRFAEAGLLQRSEACWVCSHTDKQRVQSLYQYEKDIAVVPNSVNVDFYANPNLQAPSTADGGTVLFTAAFDYPPNINAAKLLIRSIFPRLCELRPNVSLVLAGRSPTPSLVDAVAGNPRIDLTGKVADMRPYLWEADVMVIPLSAGGGTRLKLLEAFAAGLPVVATTIAVEGIAVEHGVHCMIADDPAGIAEMTHRLLNDPALANHLRQNALALVNEHFSWDAAASAITAGLQRMRLLS